MDQNRGSFITIPKTWKDYELIDCGGGEKLERFGDRILIRPEPAAHWQKTMSEEEWIKKHDIRFISRSATKGEWIKKNKSIPDEWSIDYQNKDIHLKFRLALTAFKHVGIFPEQAANWDYIAATIRSFKKPQPKVLNLFAYTGGASLIARAYGAETTHVDSIKQVITWANGNQQLSGLKDIRWLVEDALKFVKREIKRGNTYNGIILDPPAYGHGPKGEKWKLENQIEEMIHDVVKLLDKEEHFMILNTYTSGFFSKNIETLLREAMPQIKNLETGELYLPATTGKKLPISAFGRFKKTL